MKIKARVVGRTKIDPNQFITLDHVQVSDQDYSNRNLAMFTAIGSRLKQCHFTEARIAHASFGAGREMSEYVDCSFDRIHVDYAGGHARFVRCSFRDVYIQKWLAQSTELIDCAFSGRIDWAVFCSRIPIERMRKDLRRERNEFRGNDFSNVRLVEPDFRDGIDLTEQRLPTGPEYLYVPDALSAVKRLRSALEDWDSSAETRRHAFIWLHIFEEIVKRGQKQLFLRPQSNYRLSEEAPEREALDKVFELLRGEAGGG